MVVYSFKYFWQFFLAVTNDCQLSTVSPNVRGLSLSLSPKTSITAHNDNRAKRGLVLTWHQHCKPIKCAIPHSQRIVRPSNMAPYGIKLQPPVSLGTSPVLCVEQADCCPPFPPLHNHDSLSFAGETSQRWHFTRVL